MTTSIMTYRCKILHRAVFVHGGTIAAEQP